MSDGKQQQDREKPEKNKNCKTLAEEKEKKKQQKNNDRRKGRDCMIKCDRAHIKTY